MTLRKVGALLGGVAMGLASGTAMAADPVMVPPVVAAPAPMMEDHGFDWNRFYAGVQGGAWLDLGPIGFDSVRVAAVAGKNFAVGDRAVVGFDLSVGAYFDGAPLSVEIYGRGRAGVLVSPRVLLYALGGAGWDDGTWGLLIGGGAEFAVGDRVSFVVETLGQYYFGNPTFSYLSIMAGANVHFGR